MSRKNKKEEKYRKVFNEYDKNHDGFIDLKELKEILTKIDIEYDNKEIKNAFEELSSSEKGINYEDFLQFLKENKPQKKKGENYNVDEMITAFQYFDKNHDGFISVNELKFILTSNGEKMSNDEVKEIFQMCDLNNDGKIDYKEFVNFWATQ
jgi:Ca2+-binding EF-hand superfamily protein